MEDNMKMTKKEKMVTAKKSIRVSSKQKKLQKAIETSFFVFGKADGAFVPVYGPFAWVPEPERCTMQVSGGACLERF